MARSSMSDPLFDRVRSCLFEDWDPIGIGPIAGLEGPEDEYDSYARDISDMISRGGSQTEILSYLKDAEDHMGVSHSDARISRAAKSLSLLCGPANS
jgi:hypothetical protein